MDWRVSSPRSAPPRNALASSRTPQWWRRSWPPSSDPCKGSGLSRSPRFAPPANRERFLRRRLTLEPVLPYAGHMIRQVVSSLVLVAATVIVPAAQRRLPSTAPVSRYEIVKIYPHDR